MKLLLIATIATMASARPSYIAVPADQIAFLDLSSGRIRVPRQTLVPPPPPPQQNRPIFTNEDYQAALLQYPQPISVSQQEQLQQTRPVALPQPQQISSAATDGSTSHFSQRPPDFGEYVDFGAHTGDHGAFGWYADYPINSRDESY